MLRLNPPRLVALPAPLARQRAGFKPGARRRWPFATALFCGVALLATACGDDPDVTLSVTGPAEAVGGEPAPEAPADGDAAPADGDAAPADGDAAPADDAPADDAVEAPAEEVVEEAPADNGDQPDLGEPDEVVAEINETMEEQPASDGEALDSVNPLDEEATSAEVQELRGERDEEGPAPDTERRNEAGELAQLDEAAALACADVERALTAIDEGATEAAAEAIASAASRAQESGVTDIAAWSEPLSAANQGDDIAVLLGFISSCAQGGYEL